MSIALEKLTEKQQRFVIEYACDMDRQRAIREAGYSGSANTLTVRAAQLLQNPKIKAALAEVGTLVEKRGVTVELLAEQLYKFITFDPAELEDENGYLVCSLKDLPKDVRQCISSWEVEEERATLKDGTEVVTRKTKVKWIDKQRAVEVGMKWKQMFQDAVNNTYNDNRTFNWQEFYNNPPNTVEQRLNEALDNAKETKRLTSEDG